MNCELKRIASFVLALIMAVSLIPASVFAQEETDLAGEGEAAAVEVFSASDDTAEADASGSLPADTADESEEGEPADPVTIRSSPASDGATVAVTSDELPANAVADIREVSLSEQELVKLFDEEKAASVQAFVAYDIKILVDGKEWQPDNKVSVTVRDPDIEVNENGALTITHIDSETGSADAVNARVNDEGEVCFEAEGFSLYIFTVEFSYDGLNYSINGQSSILLSELFGELNIVRDLADVVSVIFSDSSLISVAGENGDWRLTPLQAFSTEQQLTVSFRDGSAIIITVTDTSYPSLEGDLAYFESFTITSIEDGMGNFDATDNIARTKDASGNLQTVESPGNDAGNNNGKVRTFDSIQYNLRWEAETYTSGDTVDQGLAHFRFVLPLSADEADWDLENMSWMQNAAVTTETIGGVLCRVLTGDRLFTGTPGTPAFPGFGTLVARVKVLQMANGAQVTPTFSAWLDNNSTERVITTTATPITVTCAPKYNVQLRKSSNITSNAYTYDFTTGDASAMDRSAGSVEGYIQSFGITVQLYNDRAEKGLMGLALPSGPITFAVDLSTAYTPGGATDEIDVTDEYTPLVWGWGPQEKNNTDVGGRNLTTGGITNHPVNAAPFNAGGSVVTTAGSESCKNGGTWSASKSGNTVQFTVSGYEIDRKYFPNANGSEGASSAFYYDPRISGYEGVQQIGCFSAGKIFVVVPTRNAENQLPEESHPGTGNGSFVLRLQDHSLSAPGTCTSTDISNQMNQTDDIASANLAVGQGGGGGLSQMILWSCRNNSNCATRDVFNGTTYHVSGKDWQLEGGQIAILWGADNEFTGPENKFVAVRSLMKFDPAVVEIVGDAVYSNLERTINRRVLYAAKPDGSAWTDDAEMEAAVMENLVYFESLSALESVGKICVGVLYETDPAIDAASVEPISKSRVYIPVTVKADTARLETYMCTAETRIWRPDTYERYSLVSMLNNDPANPIRLPAPSAAVHPAYQKTVYYESGGCRSDEGGCTKGDSLLVLKTKSTIQKQTAQTDTTGGVEEPKTKYDLDYGQRTVDYVLHSQLYNSIDPDGEEAADGTTLVTVNVQDTLPAGLTYLYGSAYYGGIYTENTQKGSQGTVTGGTRIDPEIEIDLTTGTQTLTWELENVPVNGEMLPIYFSASIGTPYEPSTDVHHGVKLKNNVNIRSTGDYRDLTAFNGNISEKEITISKLSRGSVYKKPDELFVEAAANGTVGYTMVLSNLASSGINRIVMDTLPYNGDSFGSSFTGTYTIQAFTLDMSQVIDSSGWEVYYTTDEAARNTFASDYTEADIRDGTGTVEWTEADIEADGSVPDLTGTTPTAIVTICSLGATEVYKAHVQLQKNLYAGEKFLNTLSTGDIKTQAKVEVISRSLEGCLWIDANENGARDAAEPLPTGIKVTLLKKNESTGEYEPVLVEGEPVECVPGSVTDVNTGEEETGEAGHYMFTGLSAGTYAVKFEGTSLDFSHYEVTEKNKAGVPEHISSKADGYYTIDGALTYTRIDGIEMKSKEQLISERITGIDASQNNDSGIYLLKGNLQVSKTVLPAGAGAGESFTFTVTLGDTSINGRYGDMTFIDGVETFTLEDGKSKTAVGLPDGTTYTVSETPCEGYITSSTGDEGTITAGTTSTAAFTNTSNPSGSLEISKTVAGDLGDRNKDFTFTVTLDAAGSFSYTGSKTGTIASGGTVTLKHGESIQISGIPAGTEYSVSETPCAGYLTTSTGESGKIQSNMTSAALFTNTRSSVPQTGDDSALEFWLGLTGLSLVGEIFTLFSGKVKRKKGKHE